MIATSDGNITTRKGDTFNLNIKYYSETGGVRTLNNLTGYTAKMQVKNSNDCTNINNIILDLSSGGVSPAIILGGVLGTIDITVLASVMETLLTGSFSYDLELTNGAFKVTPLSGLFTIIDDTTR